MPECENVLPIPAEPDKNANVEAYTVEPQGPWLMIEAELAPEKSQAGLIYHIPKTDEVLRRGHVVAVGRDVKRIKKGQRILYNFSAVLELEQFYRNAYGKGAPKFLVKEENILAVIEGCVLNSDGDDAENSVRCLKPAELNKARDAEAERIEQEIRRQTKTSSLVVPNPPRFHR